MFGQHFAGRQHRSSRLGYDCYTCGPMQGDRLVKCQLHLHRIPPYVSPEVRPHLPRLMFWPEENHAAAHTMIEAVLAMDVTLLNAWRKEYPDHQFGYESFCLWCHRTDADGRKVADRAREALGRAPALTEAAGSFTGEVVHEMDLIEGPLGFGCSVCWRLVRFKNDDAAIRMIIRSPTGLVLSKAFVDLIDDTHRVTVHYPGRYQAEGVPESLLADTLGSDERVRTRRRVEQAPAVPHVLPLGMPDRGADRVQASHEAISGPSTSREPHLVNGSTGPDR